MTLKDSNKKNDFIHGESFPDGVMFNDDQNMSIAIRKKDGSIKTKLVRRLSLLKKKPVLNFIIVKGIIRFFEGSINQGISERYIINLKENCAESINQMKAKLSIILFLISGILLYFIIPTLVVYFLKEEINNIYYMNMIEIVIRFLIFFVVFVAISQSRIVKKTSGYHGAEHKIALCYLNNEKVNKDNIKKYSIYNPSCGTNFMILLILFSIPFLIFLPYNILWLRILIIIVLMPLILGISFDISTWLGKSDSKIAKIIGTPGVYLQRLNTKQPTDEQVEVALTSFYNLTNN